MEMHRKKILISLAFIIPAIIAVVVTSIILYNMRDNVKIENGTVQVGGGEKKPPQELTLEEKTKILESLGGTSANLSEADKLKILNSLPKTTVAPLSTEQKKNILNSINQ